jgi:formylglycine-generating enzyme required for sulfatase activity
MTTRPIPRSSPKSDLAPLAKRRLFTLVSSHIGIVLLLPILLCGHLFKLHAQLVTGLVDFNVQAQTISFAPLSDRLLTMSPFTLSATSSSGLPVSFAIMSGPATLNGSTVTLTNTGRVTIRAEQAGNDVYGPANAEQSFEVYATLPHQTPPSWLARYGLTEDLIEAELLDMDGDGHAMWQEYVAGTDPTNRDSVFTIQSVAPGADGWQLTFSTQPNRVYQVEHASTLSSWQVLEDNLQGDGQPKTVTDPVQASQRFYRVTITSFSELPPEIPGMVWIEPGTFLMGSPANEMDRFSDEGPQTEVTLTRGFWMGRYPVTQREYLALMGVNPASFTGELERPVERVSWHDATEYCAKLTAQERAAERLPHGYEYRLPTEAQWEYACRAGTTTRFSYGDDLSYTQLGQYAWYWSNSGSKTHPVGQKSPNAWGLYDMHGNVWEWCADWYGSYPGGSVTDPKGASSGSLRVFRGGSWSLIGQYCRSGFRNGDFPEYRGSLVGFRPALVYGPVNP